MTNPGSTSSNTPSLYSTESPMNSIADPIPHIQSSQELGAATESHERNSPLADNEVSSDGTSMLCNESDWERGLEELTLHKKVAKTLEGTHNHHEDQDESLEDTLSAEEEEDEVSEARQLLWENSDSDDDDDIEAPQSLLSIVEKNIHELERVRNPVKSLLKSLKQLVAVREYELLRQRYAGHGRSKHPATNASEAIARSFGKGGYFARQIRSNARYLQTYHCLPPTKQQEGHGQFSLLDNERVLRGVRLYLAAKKLGEITPKGLADHVNTVISPALGYTGKNSTICEKTSINWLHKLGYKYCAARKGVYIDGHQRPDVQAALVKFLQVMQELQL